MVKQIITHLAACFALAAGVAVLGNVAQAASPDIVKTCFGCHGDKGVSENKDIPSIAGMSAFYIEGELTAYQKGERTCSKNAAGNMCEISKKLTPDEVKAASAYFETQHFSAGEQAFDSQKAAKGKGIFQVECEKCHSAGGSSPSDDAGILAGQWLPYLENTIKDFRGGKRPYADQMKPKLEALTPEQIDSLLNYFASEGAKK